MLAANSLREYYHLIPGGAANTFLLRHKAAAIQWVVEITLNDVHVIESVLHSTTQMFSATPNKPQLPQMSSATPKKSSATPRYPLLL